MPRTLRRLTLATAFPLALWGCANPQPITTNPIQNVTNAVVPPQLSVDHYHGLQDAEFNLDSAISIGILQAGDNADTCIHSVLVEIGEEAPGGGAPIAGQQFTPKVSDLISGGSVLYILAVQAKGVTGNLASLIPPTCQALIGQFVINGANVVPNSILGAITANLPGSGTSPMLLKKGTK